MNIYTNLPNRKEILDHTKKLLGEHRITWKWHPSVNEKHPTSDQFDAIMKSREILIAEQIGFIVINVHYEMEGHVDRGDLYRGSFTYSENLIVRGYTKNLGEFSSRLILQTEVPARSFGKMESYLTKNDWGRIVNSITMVTSLTPKGVRS